jgi:hypothetical protein
MNSFITLAIYRTAARRQARRSRVASSTDAEFTVVTAKAIPDMRAKADGDE